MFPLKCFLASVSKIALLVFLPSLATAQSSVVWKTNYYAVGGATLQEIHQSFRQARPWKDKSSFDGQTDWRIDWHFQVTTIGESCRSKRRRKA